MTHRRPLAQAVVLLFSVILPACAPADDDLGEAQEDVAEKVVRLPYTAPFHFSDPILETQIFELPQGASLTVTADGGWDRPAACPRKPYVITPFGKGWTGRYTNGLDPRFYPSNGATHRETWRNIEAGRYRLTIEPGDHDPHCTLVGTITISSP